MTPPPITPTTRDDQRLAKAMSHPVRLRLLGMLNDGIASPKELAERVGEPLDNIAYHMRVLARLGCIELVRTERRRGATAHYYRALTRAFIDSQGSADLELEARTAISATVLEDAFRLAFEATARGTFDSRTDRHLALMHLRLTEAGWSRVNAMLDEVIEEALALQAEALAPETPDEDTIGSDLVMAHFPAPRGTIGPTGIMGE
jgi:DNA-binding transcriptional ArsR family regulator